MLIPQEISLITPHKEWCHTSPYPPLGFLPFFENELGNGDSFGLYWPIGRELTEPIVAETWHDERRLQPIYSSLKTFLALTTELEDEYPEQPTILEDPYSPRACLNAAKLLTKSQDPNGAVSLLEKAVSILPEYTEALTLLWGQYVRLGRLDEAAQVAVRAIISPPSFGERPVKILRWLCSASCPSLITDPIWAVRAQLKLAFGGAKENGDYPLLLDAIKEYLRRSEFVLASTLMQTYAELMSAETTAFQERYGFNKKQFIGWQTNTSALIPGGPRDAEF